MFYNKLVIVHRAFLSSVSDSDSQEMVVSRRLRCSGDDGVQETVVVHESVVSKRKWCTGESEVQETVVLQETTVSRKQWCTGDSCV